MFKFKKVATFGALALILAGCGGNTSSQAPSTGPKKTVKLAVSGPKEEIPIYQELAKRFNNLSDPTFKVDLDIKDIGEGDAATEIAKDVSIAPDVFMFADDQLNQLYTTKVLAKLSDGYANIVKERDSESSVLAASAITPEGDVLHAFPISDDNGYFLYYNTEFLTATDVETLEGLLAKTTADKQFVIDLATAYYSGTFILNTGKLTYDPIKNIHETDLGQPAIDAITAANAIIQPKLDKGFLATSFDNQIANMGTEQGSKVIAGVSGMWNAAKIKDQIGDKMATAKLPSFTVGDKSVNMSSFAGSKLVGVKSSSTVSAEAMEFAEFITNQESQEYRYEVYQKGPSNKVVKGSDGVKANIALAGLAAQSPHSLPQARTVGGTYWDVAGSIGTYMSTDQTDSTQTPESMLTAFVTAVTTPAA